MEIRDNYNLPILSIDPDHNGKVIHIQNGDARFEQDITACGNITVGQNLVATCSISTNGFITGGAITAGDITAQRIDVSGPIYAGTGYINSISADHIILSGETLVSWADLNPILRFTSPELPANCTQFYFEGCGTVTGTELPFIQVRETATGKLVQTSEMDVWVNLNETCTAYTLGKPIANIEPCSSAIEAGKWTAIVMN